MGMVSSFAHLHDPSSFPCHHDDTVPSRYGIARYTEDLKHSVPACEFRRIRILLSLSGDIIYYFYERRRGGTRDGAYERRGMLLYPGDNLHRRRIRTKLAESFVFFQSRKFRGNYFGLIFANPERVHPCKTLFVISQDWYSSLFLVMWILGRGKVISYNTIINFEYNFEKAVVEIHIYLFLFWIF